MDLRAFYGLALFLCVSLWTVNQVNSHSHRTYQSDANPDRSRTARDERKSQVLADDDTNNYHHTYHHHHQRSPHWQSKQARNLTTTHQRLLVDDDYKSERRRSSTALADPEEDLQSVVQDNPMTLSSPPRKNPKSHHQSRRKNYRLNKSHGRRGSKSWRRRGPSHKAPVTRPRDDQDDDNDDDYDYDGDTDRHAYIMTSNSKPAAKKQEEDDVISWAMDQHSKPHSFSKSKSTTTRADTGFDERETETEPAPVTTTTDDDAASSTSDDELKHDVYAYQLPSDLWFIVRYARDSDGHVEKYMNIVDSFTNYLDKLEEGVRTVSVNVKGVETVFRLTPKHKPFHSKS